MNKAITLKHARFATLWGPLWGLPLSFFLVYSLAVGNIETTLHTVGQLLLCAAATVLSFRRQFLVWTFSIVLSCYALIGFLAWYLTAYTWHDQETISATTVIQNLTRPNITDSRYRQWLVPAGVQQLSFNFSAKLTGGHTGWNWFRSQSDIVIQQHAEGGATYERIFIPLGHDPFVMRTFNTGKATGGRTFRVTLSLRSEDPIEAIGCRGVWLQVWGDDGSSNCLPVRLTSDWNKYELIWQVPNEATSNVIRVVLNDFDGLAIDARDVSLFEELPTGTKPLGPLLPTAGYVEVKWDNELSQPHSGYGFLPSLSWSAFSYTLDNPVPSRESLLTIVLHGEPKGQSSANPFQYAVSDVLLESSPTNVPSPRPTPIDLRQNVRHTLFFAHPNLAGHSLAAVLLALFSCVRQIRNAIFAVALGLPLIYATGSRAALLAAMIGLVLAITPVIRNMRWRNALFACGILVTVSLLGLSVLGLTMDSIIPIWDRPAGLTPRVEIFKAAWSAFIEHPWTGIGDSPDSFQELWLSFPRDTVGDIPAHAHNLWLHYSSSYGIVGLLSILWITIGLSVVSWRLRRSRGLNLTLAILLLQFVDFTLYLPSVLLPLLLAINAWDGPSGRSKSEIPDNCPGL